MAGRSQRGTVLVTSLILLALLSLLGAGSLMNATLDAQLTSNQAVSKEAFYAAEAGLEVGAGRLFQYVRENLRPLAPSTVAWAGDWTEPDPADGDPFDGSDFNGYRVEYRISYSGTTTASGEPASYDYTTFENGQGLEHEAYTYLIEARATDLSGTGGFEEMSETVQILETPLVQYYVFFDDDLGWHPGPEMTSWGRIHTNGDLGFANVHANGVTFRNYDGDGNETPCVLSVSGKIRYAGHLQQNGTWGTRTPTDIKVRVRNLSTIPSTSSADYEEILWDIDGSNKAVKEELFKDSAGVYHVRVGVDRMPSASYNSLAPGGFYAAEAAAPKKPNVDGMTIQIESGSLVIRFNPFDGAAADVTDLVHDYEVASGVAVDLATWPQGARTNADNTLATASANLPAQGSIVYAPEQIVETDDGSTVATYTAARGAGANPRYPCVLERQDDREGKQVDLTVIDLQRLQYWYRDYLDYRDGGGLDGSINLANRSLLVYVSRTGATGTGASNLQAVKIVGSRAGRTRGSGLGTDLQTSPTLLVPTTVATDNPLYLDGDFNSPSHAGGATSPGAVGCALISDALTLLSDEWGSEGSVYGNTGGTLSGLTGADTETVYNAAFFTGRYNFRSLPTSGEEAGIHNFPHFLENWNTTCHITGCLINLWFSVQSEGPHGGSYYSPPTRSFGWDANFANRGYWPPYVPSIYSMERTAWRED
ncbi:MAG: hypothetical protein Kow0092_07700 [Deferrisomatales bacterium]